MNTKIVSGLILSLVFSVAGANENYLNQATKLMDVDQGQAFNLLKQNTAKFKTVAEKQRLADWYYTYGQRSEALRIYSDITTQSPNIDALVSKYMILDQKNPSGKSDSLTALSTVFDIAKKQHNLRYLHYVGSLALELKDYATAKAAFELATMYGDSTDSMLGLGLALEKTDMLKAVEYYISMLDNELVQDTDRVLVKNRLTFIQNNKGN